MAGMKYSDYVDYGRLDPFKRAMLNAVKAGVGIIKKLNIKIIRESIGGPAVVFDFLDADHMLAFTNDGVGTKTIVDNMMSFSRVCQGKSFCYNIGYDLIAANVNDLICVGAAPFALLNELMVDKNSWFDGPVGDVRIFNLISGLRRACEEANIIIPGGETAVMSDVLNIGNYTLSGSALGIIQPKKRAILGGQKIREGDVILGLASNGIHANGLTLARRIVEKRLKQRFLTSFGEKTVGEELLRPSKIYVNPVLALWEAGIAIHYMSHITGSGWKKIMRARQPFTYQINYVPPPHPIFTFLQNRGQVTDKQAYQTWNMGVGFVVILKPDDAKKARSLRWKSGARTYVLGIVKKGPKEVRIRPLNIIYKGE